MGRASRATQRQLPIDPHTLTEAVRASRTSRRTTSTGIGRAPFNNTDGFVSSPAVTDENGGDAYTMQVMADAPRGEP